MIAVIGGGLAGCAAAVRLAKLGQPVHLLERSAHLGGRAGTPGWTPSAKDPEARRGRGPASVFGPLDVGQHVFLRCCEAYVNFLAEVGALDKVRLQSRLEVAVYDGSRPGAPPALLTSQPLPTPFHMALSVMRYPFLTWRERRRLLRVVRAARFESRHEPRLRELTFAEWLRGLGQTERAIERFWDVIIVPTLNAPSRVAAAEAGLMVLQEALFAGAHAADIGRATVPLSQLLDGVAPLLIRPGGSVRTDAFVRRITPARHGRFLIDVAGSKPVHARAVVVAVDHGDVTRLLPASIAEQPFFQRVKALRDAPIIDVHLLYDRRLTPPGFDFATFLNSDVQWLFRHPSPPGAPPGSEHLSITLSSADAYIRRSNDQLQEHFTRELARLFPGSRARLLAFTTTRQRRATFLPAPGSHRGRLPQRTPIPGLYLAGDWTDCGWPATMEGAVRSGNLAAQALWEDMGSPGNADDPGETPCVEST